MSTLDDVVIDVDPEFGTVTASWSDGDEAAGLTVSRELAESPYLKSVITGLVDDIERAAEEASKATTEYTIQGEDGKRTTDSAVFAESFARNGADVTAETRRSWGANHR